ncbi:MAG: class 1 fructose-bisphosphatase [Pseudomonadota bacterium]
MTEHDQAAAVLTLQSHILAEEKRHPGATGTLSWILSALSLAAKTIASQLRRARLDDVLGAMGTDNVQGEAQQKLDVISNNVLLRCLGDREGVAIVASEENEEPVIIRDDRHGPRRYCVLFDPLDGSSNLDVAGSVGTIFSIVRHDRRTDDASESLLQPGSQQVAAGYVLYGSSTVFVMSVGSGVHMFVLDPAIGAFIRVAENLKIPAGTRQYSLNEGNRMRLPESYRRYLDAVQQDGYSARYVGAMVADVHRVLLKGGVFMYPPTESAPSGKLRLLYEANPMGFLIEQAGGLAHTGSEPLLAMRPREIHQRTGVILGARDEVERVLSFVASE